jgi:hypothetical protein
MDFERSGTQLATQQHCLEKIRTSSNNEKKGKRTYLKYFLEYLCTPIQRSPLPRSYLEREECITVYGVPLTNPLSCEGENTKSKSAISNAY